MIEKVFKVCIKVSGGLQSSYVFENEKKSQEWIQKEFPKLQKKYGELKIRKEELPGLKIGNECNVYGEAMDVFVIKKLIKYSEDRYGFLLDSGCVEEVAKCHTEFLEEV